MAERGSSVAEPESNIFDDEEISHQRIISSSTKITQQPPTASEAPYQLFMQEEDEMASLLHYPLEDDFSSPGVADLLYLTPTTKFDIPPPPATVPPPRPPIPPSRRTELLADSQSSKLPNFMHVSRQSEGRGGGVEPSQPLSVRESTVVDSSDIGGRISSTGDKFGSMSSGDVAAEQERRDFTVTSSSGGSGSMMPNDRKRKSSTMDDQECHDEVSSVTS